GVDLFVRGARGMTLTDAGRALLPYAERVLAQVVEGRKAVQELRGGKVGELLIGAAPAVSTYFLPGVLKTYQATHRDVRLGVRTGVARESVIGLANVGAAKRRVPEGVGVPLLPRGALLAGQGARSPGPVGIIGAPPVGRPIVAFRRADAGPPMGPVADFLAM